MMNQKISVVVLTKNSQKHLKKCLKSIVLQEYPDFEIIVVDSGSTDDTYNIIKHYQLQSGVPFKIEYVHTKTSIGKARQLGLEASTGEIMAYIDSDIELPHKHWLENMYQPFLVVRHNTIDGIQVNDIAGVQTLAKNKDTDPEILKKIHSRFEYKNNIIDINHYEMVGTGHILIRKELIEQVGGFRDICSGEDLDVTIKIMMKVYKFIYLPSEKVYHYHVDSYYGYIKKYWIRNKLLALRRIFLERG